MSKIIEGNFSLTEILVKTTYQVVIHKESTFQNNPIAFGSGFFVNYKDKLFFITADHNIHIEDHEVNERLGKDNYLAVLNNISDKETFSTLMTPIGGFYYMESFDFSKKDLNPQLIDVAISLVDNKKFQAPFLTDEDIPCEDSTFLVKQGEEKFEFLEEHIIEPSENDSYFIFGKIRPQFKGLILHRTNTFKNNLKYIGKSGRYLLLNAEEVIFDYDDWSGLSGSPVINQNGQCIGVLCSVTKDTKSVYIKPFCEIKVFLDTIILQEQINNK